VVNDLDWRLVGQAEQKKMWWQGAGQGMDLGWRDPKQKQTTTTTAWLVGLSRRVRPPLAGLAAGLTSYMICSWRFLDRNMTSM
jgi:hypothetical protein